MQPLEHAVAYFNTDVAVAGPDFSVAAVPSLKQFVRELTRAVPSPLGGTVYQQWRISHPAQAKQSSALAEPSEEVQVGDLGSGSDFTPFFQHAGVPSTDISSDGPYGVYHSVFDNYAWFTLNADPKFVYLQQMARVFGLEALRMADAEVLPYDYVTYAREITAYLDAAQRKASELKLGPIDFASAIAASAHLTAAAQNAYKLQTSNPANPDKLNLALRQTETALLIEAGLPNRPWYRHTIFAPGEYTGYSAVVLPGVNEALDAHNASLAAQQLAALAQALERAARTLKAAQ
jgi:N-acetylated-alpha-linked acidic dipeptidase